MKVVGVLPEVGVSLKSLMLGSELHEPAVVVSEGTLDGGRAVWRVIEQCRDLLDGVVGEQGKL